MIPSLAREKPVLRPPGRLGRALRYAVLLLILMALGSGPPPGQAQIPAGHRGSFEVFPRTFAPGQTVIIRSQTAFPPGALPGVEFSGVPATTVRTTPDRMALHVIVPGITLAGTLRLALEAGRYVDLGPFTLIGGGGGPAWIPCTGSPPTYEVIWSHLQSPAEVSVGTKVTAQVLFHDGVYTPGHWEGETPTPGVWPWTSKSFFPESGNIGRDGTKLYVRISGSHALDICDLALGETKVQTTVTGIFDAAGANGGDDGNKYTSDELGTPTYDYDPGDDKAPVSTHFVMPPLFPWYFLIGFPRDEGNEAGEIHGEVSMDAPYGTYELHNYTLHKKRGLIPTLCKAAILVKQPPPYSDPPVPFKEIPLSLKILSIDCAEDPVQARLLIQASDPAVARQDYEIYSEHGDEVKEITTWPYQTEPDAWDNRGGGQGVHSGSGPAATKLRFRPRSKPQPGNQATRPLTLSFSYIPTQGGTPDVSYRPFRMTHVQLVPVQLNDIKDHANTGDNVSIADWDPTRTITESNIGWIDPHSSPSDAAPRMPQLEMSISGLPLGMTLEAKLEVKYERGNGLRSARTQAEDLVKIPPYGGFHTLDSNTWRIWNAYPDQPFFGGDATLTYRLRDDQKKLVQSETVKFRIGGRNPTPALAKSFIESMTEAGPQGALWFGYAIAKSESRDYNGEGSRYNQFLLLPRHRRDASRPLWGNDGGTTPGGYGMFQVTGTAADSTANIPRQQIWNWQENARAGLVILQAKRAIADTWMTRQKNDDNAKGALLPALAVGRVNFVENTSRSMTHAVTMKAWNGASAAPAGFIDNEGAVTGFIIDPQGGGHFCYWKNSAKSWALSRFNNPPGNIQPFNYVHRVCEEVE